ncbi:hypothetical protein D3C81_2081010 [compost metagenome]
MPGPTPATVLAAPVSEVIQSRPRNDRPSASSPTVAPKKNEKVRIERTISSSSGWPLYFWLITARGWINW